MEETNFNLPSITSGGSTVVTFDFGLTNFSEINDGWIISYVVRPEKKDYTTDESSGRKFQIHY